MTIPYSPDAQAEGVGFSFREDGLIVPVDDFDSFSYTFLVGDNLKWTGLKI
jgi:hypothetical protein